MGLFDRWRTWNLERVPRPWPESAVSLLSHLRSHTDPASGKLSEAGHRLPDEPPDAPDQLRWAPGALDGVMGHHAGCDDDALRVKQLEKALVDMLTAASESHLAHLYRLVTREAHERDPVLRAWRRLGVRYAKLGLGREPHEPAGDWAARVLRAQPRATALSALSARFAEWRYAASIGRSAVARSLVRDLRAHRPNREA